MRKYLYLILFIFLSCKTSVEPLEHVYVSEHHQEKLKEFEKDNNKYKVLFMGDSITEGGYFENVVPNSKNVAIGGDYIYCVNFVIPYVKKYQPEKIYLMIGVNSLRDFSLEECKEQYKELLVYLLKNFPETQIILESVLPVLINYQPINNFNEYIKQLACEFNLRYFDLYPLFAVNEVLPANLTIDGLHLSPDGYKIWYKALEKEIRE